MAVAQSQRFVGELPIKALPRLVEVLANDEGSLQVELVASRIAKQSAISGQIAGQVQLQCQRCDQVYSAPLKLAVDLRLVESEEEEKKLLQGSDPYRVQDDSLRLHELIEDETLLGLPMLPRCDSCENSVKAAPLTPERDPRNDRENPFAALKKLKF